MHSYLKAFAGQYWQDRWKQTGGIVPIYGIPGGATGFALAALRSSLDPSIPLLVVTPGSVGAESLALDLELFLESSQFTLIPEKDGLPYDRARRDAAVASQRIHGIIDLCENASGLYIAPIAALMRRIVNPSIWQDATLHLRSGMSLEPGALLKRLLEIGYHRVERVEGPGDACLKGSVLDIYSPGQDPIRLDFFDIEIDSIRHFDPESQRSKEVLQEAEILPVSEDLLPLERLPDFLQALDAQFSGAEAPDWLEVLRDAEQASVGHCVSGRNDPGLEDIIGLVLESRHLLELFPSPPLVFLLQPEDVEKHRNRVLTEYHTIYDAECANRMVLAPQALLEEDPLHMEWAFQNDHEDESAENANALVASPGKKNGDESFEPPSQVRTMFAIREELADLDRAAEVSASPLRRSPVFQGRISELRKAVEEKLNQGATVILTSPYHAQIQRLNGIFRGESMEISVHEDPAGPLIPEGSKPAASGSKKSSAFNARKKKNDQKQPLYIVQNFRSAGFEVPDLNLFVWSDHDIFGRSYSKRNRFKARTSSPIESFLDLKEGDYVVHINHGVGRFVKLERVKAAGRERDFLVLEYAEQDRLFVPLDQISLVQKYAAPTEKPRLDHLGRASFKKVRERVEERIEEFAEELLKIYAARMSRKGYAYPPDSPWQEEFEAAFPFEETPDQITAIEAVKQDMETARPMDRLVCGDVGYGKTEVAIRAAFKAVMGGKQVAVICPTTILALQHFKNFKDRYGEFPVRVDWISRFRSRKEITETKKNLEAGDVDVVIGTHALLARDIKFKSLGLLIVDEEQRFGVTHKEALKKMKALVDVLTLTATPIPRTLHLSLTGIRDLSIIQTPPRDRRPVQTYVMEDSDTVLLEAVQRELERGGQVFYLHNRIQDLEAVSARIAALMPEVTFTTLHGQMNEDDIENILLDFLNRRYDLLLTTAIIENGIDMPNVNTLIVDRADSFGLSQLYQIRGRVGRSSRQAYAYFFHPGKHILTEQAQKRLNTLLEYQELGSGFKVAMRDLEIRGAGNLLGKEQSGDIMDVGYELYIKFLDDAVRRLKGEEVSSDFRCAVNLKTDFYLPDDYIPDTRQKIEFYKRFEAAIDLQEVESIAGEMEDRFGPPRGPAQQFVLVEKIRTLCSTAGFETVFEEAGGIVQLEASDHFRIPPNHMIAILKGGHGFRVKPGKSDTLYFEPQTGKNPGLEQRLEAFLAALLQLTAPLQNTEKPVATV
ncbi:MAG: transcription-repair coupling factor [Leptospiraceae bacterium]|nr:transcription-repair coupling factor [Leptospiraceae bacterium]